MSKSFIKASHQFTKSLTRYRLETGFSMLEAVVVVGVLLALAVGGFFAYGPITENAKTAKVKSAASEVLTAATVASFDGYAETQPQDVIDTWNSSTDKIHVEILEPTSGSVPTSDFCVRATNISDPTITTLAGTCSEVTEGGGLSPDEMANPVAQPAVMVSTWDTRLIPSWDTNAISSGEPLSCSTITLPLTGTVDAVVNWGDGTSETVTTILPKHTYADTPGVKTITIDGTFTGWVGENWNWTDWGFWSVECITEVKQWGETGTTDVVAGFEQASNLTNVDRIPSGATNWDGLFAWNSNFNGDISDWDTSMVTNMNYLFAGASSFNGDISLWDTSKVTNMYGAFHEAVDFNQNINSWDTSSVTTMDYMFTTATSFDKPLNNWNTSNVVSMTEMFRNATIFNKDISSWNVSKVTPGTAESFRTRSALQDSYMPAFQ